MRKLGLALLFFIFFVTACAKTPTSPTLKFTTWGSATEVSILEPIIKEYEAKNSQIRIELVHIPQNYFQKLHLLFASNLAPDVVFINNLNLPIYADYLETLDYDSTKYYPQTVQSLSYKGEKKAVPRDVSNLVIYYNKDLFKNNPQPKTIDELFKVAQKLTDKTHYGISFESDMFYAIPYIYAFNQSIYDDTELKGLRFYKDLAYKYHVAPQKSDVGSKTVAQLFLEGKIAMHLSGRWLYPKYKEAARFNWGVMTFPTPVPCDSSGWAISKSSTNKTEAMKFINYLSSKENIAKLTSTGLIVPARKDVEIDDTVFKSAILKSKTIEITQDYKKLLDRLKESYKLAQ